MVLRVESKSRRSAAVLVACGRRRLNGSRAKSRTMGIRMDSANADVDGARTPRFLGFPDKAGLRVSGFTTVDENFLDCDAGGLG